MLLYQQVDKHILDMVNRKELPPNTLCIRCVSIAVSVFVSASVSVSCARTPLHTATPLDKSHTFYTHTHTHTHTATQHCRSRTSSTFPARDAHAPALRTRLALRPPPTNLRGVFPRLRICSLEERSSVIPFLLSSPGLCVCVSVCVTPCLQVCVCVCVCVCERERERERERSRACSVPQVSVREGERRREREREGVCDPVLAQFRRCVAAAAAVAHYYV